MIGKTILQYKILEQLGEGGMGVVYKARDTRLDRLVALKFLPADFASGEDRERLLGEARAAAAVNHPNICSIYDVQHASGDEFLVMEYVEGSTLRSQLDSGAVELAHAVAIALQVAAGLEAAHKKGIIHRDIKPENVLITPEGVAKIADFGLAKSADRMAGAADGNLAGTLAYMSPEQIQGGAVGRATDLWSLGVVLYEMAAGRRPFLGEYAEALMYTIVNDKHRPLAELRPDAPPALSKAIDRCLEKNPDVRFADAGALIEELRFLESDLKRPRRTALRSIAVLPFADISPEKDNQYFSDGLTEEITANLSKLRLLRVLPRTSTANFDRSEKGTKQIADELGVQYLLEGSIRKHGTDLRITTQLIDAAKESYEWSESFRGTMDDVFDIQEKVAAKVVKALKVSLTPKEKKTLKRRATKNSEAYQLYLKGRFFWNKRNKKDLETAIRYFEQAIESDPSYPEAWAGLADAYSLLSEHPSVSRKETYPKVHAAVSRALELDPNLPEARASLAMILMLYEWDWEGAEREFKLSIYLDPNYATAHHWYSEYLIFRGRADEAIAENLLAAQLDPLSPAILKDIGMTYYYARKFDKALEYAHKTLELAPDFFVAYRLMALAHHGKGMYAEALAENKLWAQNSGNVLEGTLWDAYFHASSGNKEEAKRILDTVLETKEFPAIFFRGIALTYLELGDPDRAIDWLTKGVDLHSESLASMKVDYKMDKLRSDPRFRQLLVRIGLEK